jgi:hypothetical protein
MNFVEFSIAIGALAAQMQSAQPYFRGPPVVYVPPGHSAPMPPPVYRYPRATSDIDKSRARPLSRDEERERIIDAGEAFCRKWPDDKVCHAKE